MNRQGMAMELEDRLPPGVEGVRTGDSIASTVSSR